MTKEWSFMKKRDCVGSEKNSVVSPGLIQDEKDLADIIENFIDCFGIFSAIRNIDGQVTDFYIKYLNQSACNDYNMVKEKLIGKKLLEVLPGHLDSGIFHKYVNVVQFGQSYKEKEVPYKEFVDHSDHSDPRVYDINAIKFNDGVAVAWRNVSNLKRLEEEQIKNERNYDLIMENISDIVILYEVADQDLKILKTSRSFFKTMGIDEEKFVGQLIGKVTPGKIARNIRKNFNIALKVADSVTYEENIGKYIIETKLIPIFNSDDNCTHLIVSAKDITEKRKLEENISNVEKLEAVGLLAGGIAHDFNNILTAIIGNASLMKIRLQKGDSEQTEKLLRWLNEIENACSQAKGLTQQLLTFSKGGNPILATVSMKELLIETADFALRGSNVKCEFHIEDGLWPVEVDQGQINQVVNNLLINASQAMSGGGTIIISAVNTVVKREDALPVKEGEYIHITIQDSGIGISASDIDKIFDPYFSTKQMGSGLGLTTAFSIMRKHHGCVNVESNPGEGTTFHLYLPMSDKKVHKISNQAKNKMVGKGKILVMDDERLIRSVISEMLRQLSYEVICASDGEEAIQLYKKAMDEGEPIDVLLMDLTVPGGMGGKEAMEKLLELDEGVKAIVSSGYSNNPVMADYKKFKFKGMVTKPYGIEQLSEVLQKVIFDHS